MNPFAEIVSIIIGFYIWIVLLRFLLQYFRADFYNPISQLVVKATDPLVRPLRKIIPGWGGIDNSSLVLAWLVIVLQSVIVSILTGTIGSLPIVQVLVFSIFGVVTKMIWLYMILIFIRAIVSWVVPANGYNPALMVFGQLTEPYLAKIRQKMPPMEGFDLSPIVGILILLFVNSCIGYYLMPLVDKIFQ